MKRFGDNLLLFEWKLRRVSQRPRVLNDVLVGGEWLRIVPTRHPIHSNGYAILKMGLYISNKQDYSSTKILNLICRALPCVRGSPSRNSQWPRQDQGQRGGLEIVFNQQLTRLGYYLTSCIIAPSAKITSSVYLLLVIWLTQCSCRIWKQNFNHMAYIKHTNCTILLAWTVKDRK